MAAEFTAAAALKPGDRVLVGLHREDIDPTWCDQLRAEFPGVKFVFFAGISGLAVMPAEDS